MAISHAGHNHPATPAGRRACRNAPITMASVAREMFTTPDPIRVEAPIKMTGATARKLARHAAAADKMRGARVSTAGRCPQAALHTRGRCACGWASEGF